MFSVYLSTTYRGCESKVKCKVVPGLIEVPRHEDVSTA